MFKKILSCWYVLVLYYVLFLFDGSFFVAVMSQSLTLGMFFLFLASLAPDQNPMNTAPVYRTSYVCFQCGASLILLIPLTIYLFTINIFATLILIVTSFLFNRLLQSWATFLFVYPTYLAFGTSQ